MKIGRKLLFHRHLVDDSVGTYITDYAVSLVCFVISAYMLILIRRHKRRDDKRVGSSWQQRIPPNEWYWSPWNWPRSFMTSITMTTYATLAFIISYGVMAFLGGLPHQFLQMVEPYDDWKDALALAVIWRIASAWVVFTVFSMMVILEQIYTQEALFAIPRPVRKFYYFLMLCSAVFVITINFIRLADNNPYDIERLYVGFVLCTLLHGIGMLIIVIRQCCCGCKRKGEQTMKRREIPDEMNGEASTLHDDVTLQESHLGRRLDLYLHCSCPWLIVAGGVLSYYLTPICSHDNAQAEFGCPLPDSFNHNAVMHLVHSVALLALAVAENLAINRRRRLCDVTDEQDANNNRSDSVSAV